MRDTAPFRTEVLFIYGLLRLFGEKPWGFSPIAFLNDLPVCPLACALQVRQKCLGNLRISIMTFPNRTPAKPGTLMAFP